MKCRYAVFAAVVLAASCLPARAQMLADRVPEDVTQYVGWSGTDALGPAYDKSHLKEFVDALGLPGMLRQAVDARTPAGNQEDRQAIETIIRSPMVYFAGVTEFVAPGQPQANGGFVFRVGRQNAEAVAGVLRRVNNTMFSIAVQDDDVLLFVGSGDITARLRGAPPARSLATSEDYKHALAQVGPHAAASPLVVYVNGKRFNESISKVAEGVGEPLIRQWFPVVMDGSGLADFQSFAWAGGFDGPNWKSDTFLGMGPRRTGLLAFFDHPPLSPDSLRLIPRNVSSAGAFRFDGMRLLNDITAAAGKADPELPKRIETLLSQAFVFTGIDLKRELLPSLGDEFVYYCNPAAAGNSLQGFTLFNRLKDPQKARLAAVSIESFFNLMVLQRDPNSKLQFRPQELSAPFEGLTAHVITLPNASPAWAIHDGVLFFSMSVQGLQSALEMQAGKKESLLENAEFQAQLEALGAAGMDKYGSFSFNDFPRTLPETYSLANQVLARMKEDRPELASFTLPPLEKLAPAVTPAASVSWTDGAGYHARSIGPFPGSTVLSPSAYLVPILMQQVRQSTQSRRPATGPAAAPGGMP